MISADGRGIIAVLQVDTHDATGRMGGVSQKSASSSTSHLERLDRTCTGCSRS